MIGVIVSKIEAISSNRETNLNSFSAPSAVPGGAPVGGAGGDRVQYGTTASQHCGAPGVVLQSNNPPQPLVPDNVHVSLSSNRHYDIGDLTDSSPIPCS